MHNVYRARCAARYIFFHGSRLCLNPHNRRAPDRGASLRATEPIRSLQCQALQKIHGPTNHDRTGYPTFPEIEQERRTESV